MKSIKHRFHIETRSAHSNCPECRADTERRFAGVTVFRYDHVSSYLKWIRPRLASIREGNASVDARVWHRDFVKALNRRITSRVAGTGRKWADSYLERLQGMRHADAGYLREFAQVGASALR